MMEESETTVAEAPPPKAAKRPYQRKTPYQRKVQLIPREQRKPVEPAKPAQNSITYIPLDQGDPVENLMAGIRFKANVPEIVPRSKTVQQLLVEKFETADGVRSKTVERMVPLVEVLRNNPWFEIDGQRAERVKPHARVPDDADQYRGYCINWISVSMSADSMDKRWIGEEGLRQRCGVSPSDIAYLRPFFEARRMECAELDRQRHVA